MDFKKNPKTDFKPTREEAKRKVEEGGGGEDGPQASTVQIVDKPGARVGASGESPVDPPLGWKE
jgi:hypothetical protein